MEYADFLGRCNNEYKEYCRINKIMKYGNFEEAAKITNVKFNPPATIVFWSDNTKTIVKAQNNESYDPEKGLAMAIAKKFFGNKGSYFNEISKWTDPYEEEQEILKFVGHVARLYVKNSPTTDIKHAVYFQCIHSGILPKDFEKDIKLKTLVDNKIKEVVKTKSSEVEEACEDEKTFDLDAILEDGMQVVKLLGEVNGAIKDQGYINVPEYYRIAGEYTGVMTPYALDDTDYGWDQHITFDCEAYGKGYRVRPLSKPKYLFPIPITE